MGLQQQQHKHQRGDSDGTGDDVWGAEAGAAEGEREGDDDGPTFDMDLFETGGTLDQWGEATKPAAPPRVSGCRDCAR